MFASCHCLMFTCHTATLRERKAGCLLLQATYLRLRLMMLPLAADDATLLMPLIFEFSLDCLFTMIAMLTPALQRCAAMPILLRDVDFSRAISR